MEGSREGWYRRLAVQAGLDFVSLDPAPTDPVSWGAARLVPAELSRRLGAVPVGGRGDELVVAVSSTLTRPVAAAIRGLTGRRVRFVVATPEEIRRAQDRVYGPPPVLRAGRFAPPRELVPAGSSFPRRVAERSELEFAPLEGEPADHADPAAARLVGER